ncbi:hypothetical protein KSX_53240 [Ktedonospora formicarum]|uniref:Uncharacterized protein n=1 Tax=Ktedonospora formicarum TaxID=2778364 RepID=A0A8J3I424_9CHLR|nr:hypothetical protein KSX_53240 [Ktedonospora formicarum]
MDLGLAVQMVAVRGSLLMLNHSIAPDDTGTPELIVLECLVSLETADHVREPG